MFVIPKKDMKIVDPQRMDIIPPEGRNVGTDHGPYWLRHQQDGAITVVPEAEVPAAQERLEKADEARAVEAEKARVAAEEKAAADAKAAPKPAAPGPKK